MDDYPSPQERRVLESAIDGPTHTCRLLADPLIVSLVSKGWIVVGVMRDGCQIQLTEAGRRMLLKMEHAAADLGGS